MANHILLKIMLNNPLLFFYLDPSFVHFLVLLLNDYDNCIKMVQNWKLLSDYPSQSM